MNINSPSFPTVSKRFQEENSWKLCEKNLELSRSPRVLYFYCRAAQVQQMMNLTKNPSACPRIILLSCLNGIAVAASSTQSLLKYIQADPPGRVRFSCFCLGAISSLCFPSKLQKRPAFLGFHDVDSIATSIKEKGGYGLCSKCCSRRQRKGPNRHHHSTSEGSHLITTRFFFSSRFLHALMTGIQQSVVQARIRLVSELKTCLSGFRAPIKGR